MPSRTSIRVRRRHGEEKVRDLGARPLQDHAAGGMWRSSWRRDAAGCWAGIVPFGGSVLRRELRSGRRFSPGRSGQPAERRDPEAASDQTEQERGSPERALAARHPSRAHGFSQ